MFWFSVRSFFFFFTGPVIKFIFSSHSDFTNILLLWQWHHVARQRYPNTTINISPTKTSWKLYLYKEMYLCVRTSARIHIHWVLNRFRRCPMPNFHSRRSLHWSFLTSLSLIASVTHSFQLLLGLSLFLRSCGTHSIVTLGKLVSGILWPCPYHINCFRSISVVTDSYHYSLLYLFVTDMILLPNLFLLSRLTNQRSTSCGHVFNRFYVHRLDSHSAYLVISCEILLFKLSYLVSLDRFFFFYDHVVMGPSSVFHFYFFIPEFYHLFCYGLQITV